MSEANGILMGVLALGAIWRAAEWISLLSVAAKRREAARLLQKARYQELMEQAAIENRGKAKQHADVLASQFNRDETARDETTTAGAASLSAPASFSSEVAR